VFSAKDSSRTAKSKKGVILTEGRNLTLKQMPEIQALWFGKISPKSRRHERTIFLPSGPMGPEGKKPILTTKSLLFYQNKTYKISRSARNDTSYFLHLPI